MKLAAPHNYNKPGPGLDSGEMRVFITNGATDYISLRSERECTLRNMLAVKDRADYAEFCFVARLWHYSNKSSSRSYRGYKHCELFQVQIFNFDDSVNNHGS